MIKVEYKSYEKYYRKEESDLKNNTVRYAYDTDIRTRQLKLMKDKGYKGIIKMINKENEEESFEREIRDVTFFNNLVVITWQPKDVKHVTDLSQDNTDTVLAVTEN